MRDATGWMWERAPVRALLAWSEHRYYGASQPFGTAEASLANKTYLTVEQALGDHAARPRRCARVQPAGDRPLRRLVRRHAASAAHDAPDALDARSASAPSSRPAAPACDPAFYAAVADARPPPWRVAASRHAHNAVRDEELAALGASPTAATSSPPGCGCAAAFGGGGAGWGWSAFALPRT